MWQPPPLEEINGDIHRYTLLIVESETGRQFEVTTNETQITINSLHPYYHYMCRVRAETSQPGPYSVAISVHLLQEGMLLSICVQSCFEDIIYKHSSSCKPALANLTVPGAATAILEIW